MREDAAAVALARGGDSEAFRSLVERHSRLVAPEAVPTLLAIARNDPDTKVRERAMFWLAQSKDPRALKFFEEVLMK